MVRVGVLQPDPWIDHNGRARSANHRQHSSLTWIIHDTHDGWISSVSRSPDGCARAGRLSGAGVGSMVRIAGFEIAVEGLDRGDTAPRVR
jgi:hypothetical protein